MHCWFSANWVYHHITSISWDISTGPFSDKNPSNVMIWNSNIKYMVSCPKTPILFQFSSYIILRFFSGYLTRNCEGIKDLLIVLTCIISQVSYSKMTTDVKVTVFTFSSFTYFTISIWTSSSCVFLIFNLFYFVNVSLRPTSLSSLWISQRRWVGVVLKLM